jgi:hypothetical protein
MNIKAGSRFTSDRLGLVEVINVLPMGTVEVRKVGTDDYYRISGLPMVPTHATHTSATFAVGAL